MIVVMWTGLITSGLFFAFLAFLMLRQKVTKLKSREEIFELLESGVYNETKVLHVLAGEANIQIYAKLCPGIEKSIKEKPDADATFVVGPELSYWNKMKELVGDDHHLVGGCSDDAVLDMHPLFRLFNKYPSNVKLYCKTGPNNERHFAVGDDFLYIEKYHKPLGEDGAVFIKNPSFFLKKRYQQKRRASLELPGLLEIKNVQNIKESVRFGHPVTESGLS